MDDTTVNKSKKKKPSPQSVGKIQILFSVISDDKITEVDKEGTTKSVDVSIETFYIGGHTKKPIQVFQRRMKRLKYGNYKKDIAQSLTIYELLNLEVVNEIASHSFGQILNNGTEKDPCYGYLQNRGKSKWIAAFQYSNVNAQITEDLEKTPVLNSDWHISFNLEGREHRDWVYTECKSAVYKGSGGFLKVPYLFDSNMVQDFISLYKLPQDKQTQKNPIYKGNCFQPPSIQVYKNELSLTGENKNETTSYYTGRTEISWEAYNAGNYDNIEYDPQTHKYYISGSGTKSSEFRHYIENTITTIALEMKDNSLFFTFLDVKKEDFTLKTGSKLATHNEFYGSFSSDLLFSGITYRDYNISGMEEKYLKGSMKILSLNELMDQYNAIEQSSFASFGHYEYYTSIDNSGNTEEKRISTQTHELIYYGGSGGVENNQEGGIKKISGYSELANVDSASELSSTKIETWTDYYIQSNSFVHNSLKFRNESFSDLKETDKIKPLLDDINNRFTQVDMIFYNVIYDPTKDLGSEEVWIQDIEMEVATYKYNKDAQKYEKIKEKHKVFSLGYDNKTKPEICMIHAYSFHPQ